MGFLQFAEQDGAFGLAADDAEEWDLVFTSEHLAQDREVAGVALGDGEDKGSSTHQADTVLELGNEMGC